MPVDVVVLLSTHNGEAHLGDLLASIEEQTLATWAFVAVDDGSSDGTVDLLDAWCRRDPARRSHRARAEAVGPAASFLGLLAQANAPYFAFCDQDDVWDPDKLERTVGLLRPMGDVVAAVAGDARVVDEQGRPLHPSALNERGLGPDDPTFGELLMLNAAIGATMTGTRRLGERTAAIAQYGLPVMHDWLAALVASSEGRLLFDRRPSLAYRRHERAVTGRTRTPGERLKHVLTERGTRRRELVHRAATNARLLLEGGRLSEPDAATVRLLDEIARQEDVSRRDLARLARAGARVWPRARELSLYL